jgi:transposase InsO family protein
MKWLARYRAEGLDGLLDRSSRPHRSPRRTPTGIVEKVRELRLLKMTGRRIAQLLGLARSTVHRILVRLGLNRASSLEPKEPTNSYEWPKPGELLHLDVKKLGRIRKIGKRIHGKKHVRSRGAGWEYAHVCVDDHSRVAYVEVLEDECGPTAAGFLERAVAWYAALGVRTERVLTDNGSCYKKVFDRACERLGIRHKRTRPYRPRTNGKAERFIQTMLREWAYAHAYCNSALRREALQPWVNQYNQVRRHSSLGDQPPMTRVEGSL